MSSNKYFVDVTLVAFILAEQLKLGMISIDQYRQKIADLSAKQDLSNDKK